MMVMEQLESTHSKTNRKEVTTAVPLSARLVPTLSGAEIFTKPFARREGFYFREIIFAISARVLLRAYFQDANTHFHFKKANLIHRKLKFEQLIHKNLPLRKKM